MKQCSKCYEFKEFTDFHKDKGKQDGLHAYCKTCNNTRVSVWQQTPIGRAKHSAVASNWQTANKVKHCASVNTYQATPKGKAKLRANWAKYNATKIQATPPWLTKNHLEEIESFYILAKELQWLSNEKLDVDHIVPLNGDNVCGLHVPWNLQILGASLNRRKSNKLISSF